MSTPKSLIYIMSGLPVNSSYEHCLWFASPQAQWEYMSGKVVKTFTQYSYLRENHAIKVTGDIATAESWTYCMYTNGDGKEYYNFIKKVEYVNDATVLLWLELDVIQTYMFQWNMQQCFVERTHTKTDNFGEHTIMEGLDTGPLIDKAVKYVNLENLCIMVLMSMDGDGNSAFSRVYDGVFSGLCIRAVNIGDYVKFGEWLDDQSANGTIEGVVSMWMYPKELVKIQSTWDDGALFHNVTGCDLAVYKSVDEQITDTIDGYKPDNKKLLCYPYTMLYVSNNMGGSAVYHRERFEGNEKYDFLLMGGVAPDSGVQLVPKNYKGRTNNFDEAITLGAFPTCAWDSDTYKVWLAQNQHTQDLAIQQSKISAGAGALTAVASTMAGNLMGAVGGLVGAYHGYSQIQGIMAQREDMAIQPPQARGNHSPNLNLANGRHGFDIHFRTITAEYAKIIDQYLTRYGYKVNTIMTPNLKARERFTYIKTIGCMVTGAFSDENRRKIQSIFDNGVTFWVDPERVGNYTLGNNVL